MPCRYTGACTRLQGHFWPYFWQLDEHSADLLAAGLAIRLLGLGLHPHIPSRECSSAVNGAVLLTDPSSLKVLLPENPQDALTLTFKVRQS